MQRDLSRRLSGRGHDCQWPDLLAHAKFSVNDGPLLASVAGIARMNERHGARAGPYRVGRARMVAVGEKNHCRPHPRDLIEIFIAWLDGIDA